MPTKFVYGIIALTDICLYSDNDTVTVVNISKRQNIPAKYLEQILPLLRREDIIRSVKGSRGGYVLTRPPEEIVLSDVIDAIDKNVLCDVQFPENTNTAFENVLSASLWDKMTAQLRKVSDGITMRDITEKYTASDGSSELMYYI